MIRFSVYGKSWRFPIAVTATYLLSYLFKVTLLNLYHTGVVLYVIPTSLWLGVPWHLLNHSSLWERKQLLLLFLSSPLHYITMRFHYITLLQNSSNCSSCSTFSNIHFTGTLSRVLYWSLHCCFLWALHVDYCWETLLCNWLQMLRYPLPQEVP